MRWVVLAYLKDFTFSNEIWRFVMTMNRELGFDEMFGMTLKWNMGRIPLKVSPNHELSRFLAYLNEFYFFYEIWRFVMKMNRELGLTKCSECLLKWNISRIPLKVPQTMSWEVFGLFEGILLFLRNLTFCHENESGTRIWRNVRNAYEMDAGFPLKFPNMSWVVFGLFEGIYFFYEIWRLSWKWIGNSDLTKCRNAYWNGILAGFP